jgi:hypothetical protein
MCGKKSSGTLRVAGHATNKGVTFQKPDHGVTTK